VLAGVPAGVKIVHDIDLRDLADRGAQRQPVLGLVMKSSSRRWR